jgi:hypothetical protein
MTSKTMDHLRSSEEGGEIKEYDAVRPLRHQQVNAQRKRNIQHAPGYEQSFEALQRDLGFLWLEGEERVDGWRFERSLG